MFILLYINQDYHKDNHSPKLARSPSLVMQHNHWKSLIILICWILFWTSSIFNPIEPTNSILLSKYLDFKLSPYELICSHLFQHCRHLHKDIQNYLAHRLKVILIKLDEGVQLIQNFLLSDWIIRLKLKISQFGDANCVLKLNKIEDAKKNMSRIRCCNPRYKIIQFELGDCQVKSTQKFMWRLRLIPFPVSTTNWDFRELFAKSNFIKLLLLINVNYEKWGKKSQIGVLY